MTDRDIRAELPLGSGGDAYAVGRTRANGERCKQAAQRRTCDEKGRQGKNHPHGCLQSDDGTQAERGAVSGTRSPAECRRKGPMRPYFCIFGLALVWLITSA